MRRALEALIATIVVPGGAVVIVPYFILGGRGTTLPPTLSAIEILSAPVALCGAAMVVWVSYAFVTRGLGTPVPIDPPRRFVAHGLFGHVRNPMYVGALLVVMAEAAFFRSVLLLGYALALWALLHVFTVLYEEPQLRRRFGQPYVDYLASTPRWIPRLARSRSPRPSRT